MEELKERLSKQGADFKVDDKALSLLSRQGSDPAFGARHLARVVEELVAMPLAEKILNGEIKKGNQVKVNEGEMAFLKE